MIMKLRFTAVLGIGFFGGILFYKAFICLKKCSFTGRPQPTKVPHCEKLQESFSRNTVNISTTRKPIFKSPERANVTTQYQTRNSIAFLKTHKTGSSTITSILNRFADLKNLEIALPVTDIRFNWPKPFQSKDVDRDRLITGKANMLTNHMVFQFDELKKIMFPNFKLVTILRNPTSRFRSAFYYEKFDKQSHIRNRSSSLEYFLENTPVNENNFLQRKHMLFNGLALDLNYQVKKNKSIEVFITEIGKVFDLVLITEYFDESLILLKNMMQWNFMDIAYQKKLVGNFNRRYLSENLQHHISRWSQWDWRIYNYFKDSLVKLIQNQKQKLFTRDLKIFKALNKLVVQYCLNGLSFFHYSAILDKLNEINEKPPKEFTKRPHCFCKKLMRSEKEYVVYFRRKFPQNYFHPELMKEERVLNGC